MLTNQMAEKIDGNRIKELEKLTRKLYIYRQKDRPQDEDGNGEERRHLRNEIIN